VSGAPTAADGEEPWLNWAQRHPGRGHRHHGRVVYASPATHVGYELIGAGMLILAGGGRGLPLDYDELERWTYNRADNLIVCARQAV
jgi:hypothetical protein